MSDEWERELHSIDIGKHALAYARKGWSIFPVWWCRDAQVCACSLGAECDSPGKHPMTIHGVKDASANLDNVRQWWERWPTANIGLATGRVSNVLVLDVDGDEGGRSIHALIGRYGRPANTVGSITGSGGRHLLWRYPDGVSIQNRVRCAPGLDVRSDGGHIVLPPSLHAIGERYSWHPDGHPAKVRCTQPPEWLIEMMTKPVGAPSRRAPRGSYDPSKPKPRIDVDRVPQICEGERNRTLFRLACRMRWEGRGDDELLDALQRINATRVSPPLRDREIVKIARSACRFPVGS